MPYLAAAVILVGIVAVLDLLLTVGLVKRLREHTELLAPLLTFDGEAGRRAIRPAGARPDAFEATTVDGTAVTLASLSPSDRRVLCSGLQTMPALDAEVYRCRTFTSARTVTGARSCG